MALSPDPAKRARQLANLNRGGAWARGHANRGRTTHGASAELTVAPLRDEFDAQLARRYPHVDDVRRRLLADRLARIALAAEFTDRRGILRNSRTGQVFDVVDRLERWSARAEELLAQLEAEARQLGASPQDRFAAVLAGGVADDDAEAATGAPEAADAAHGRDDEQGDGDA